MNLSLSRAAAIFLSTSPKEGSIVPTGCALADPPSLVCHDSSAGVLPTVNSLGAEGMGELFVGQRRVGKVDPFPVC